MAKARKEIDKDSMYQKIMPSAMRSASTADDVEPAAPPAKKTSTRSTPRKTAPKTPPVSAALPEDIEEVATEAEAPPAPPKKTAAPSPRKAAAPPAPDTKPNIVNVMELLIDTKMAPAMEKFHCCTCDKCRQDIAAMALNKLHPKYIVAEPEPLTAAMEDKESNMQVTTALVQAILKVKANPKH